ncbi:hypothetical protein [Bacillus horti]|uniref:Flagellar hook-length control protein FliK n=1 Tax=Caldalkalibacillus horti TaxID=77523 RepID=A0ABT9VUH8_9BACI|nr:hypothetical protein [Bacillus horti]MDQ0164636.1 hypothetical protein [Bacillus horti]
MALGNILQSMFRTPRASNNHVLTLTSGQVVKGEVLQLYPNDHALVKLGSMQVQAKLEAPLEAGLRSWFQVQGSAHPITLKLVSAPQHLGHQGQTDLAQLLQFFGMKSSALGEKLLQFFLQEQLPMTKQNVRSGTQILEQLGTRSETLQAIKFAVQKGLPLSKEIIQSLQSFSQNSSLAYQIRDVAAALPSQARGELQNLLQRMGQDIVQRPNGLLLFLQRMGVQLESTMSKAMTSFTPAPVPPTPSTQQASVVQPVTHTGTQEQVTQAGFSSSSGAIGSPSSPSSSLLENNRVALTREQGGQVPGRTAEANPGAQGDRVPTESRQVNMNAQSVTNALMDTVSKVTQATGQQGQPANHTPVQSFASETAVFTRSSETARAQETGQANQGSNTTVTNSSQGSSSSQFTDTMLRGTEAGGGRLFSDISTANTSAIQNQSAEGQQPTTLKSYLMQLLQSQELSKQAAEKVQGLIHTIQGQQILLSSETQQPIQTFMFQAFYPFGAELRSIYGQISGKKEKGKIDPENCRMFFHLELPELGQTEIDVTIQSNYLAITLYSKQVPHEGHEWLKENEVQVKEAMNQLGYTLTSVKWKEVQMNEPMMYHPSIEASRLYSQSSFQGVDIRL